jgi:putative DNA primase/helicase
MFLLVGDGANGKSVLLDLMSALYGDYHQHSRFDAFLKKKNNSSSQDLARLHNARMVTANESGISKHWDEERIKEITGGDKVTVRHLYQNHFTFKSRIKLWCATNNLPKVDDFTPAFWRRIRVIPFDRKFEGKNKDTNMIHKLKEELSGILNRIIQGFKDWTDQELANPPHQIKQAIENYKNESDVVAQFIADRVSVVEGYDVLISAKEMYESYKEWHEGNSDGKPISHNMFGRRMKALGHSSDKIGGRKVYIGLELAGQ